MEDSVDELTSIESRHKKEKKELQSQIQALKKAAKNDKSKKKELTVEILRLESELDIRHKQEITMVQINDDNVTTQVEVDINNLVKPKVSRAQKRRDKKSQQDRDREEQIKLQEKENLHGPRNLEMQAIMAKLKEKHLNIYLIPSDGDCLYKAVSHQFVITRQQELTVHQLRKNVANYIRNNKDDFIPFMSNTETCEMLTEMEFEEYCDKIYDTKVWGGQLEIRALSHVLKCPINVLQATVPDFIEQGSQFEGPPLIITYHRHMYSLGEHYNSTIMNNNEE